MTLPAAVARKHIHTRAVEYQGFLRDDGLWDIEASLNDSKTYAIELDKREVAAGTPIHGMLIRVTVDDTLTIRDIVSDMPFAPYGECQQGREPMRAIIGAKMGPGWRQAIEKALGGVRGCTHMREMLFNMATAAYQTVYPYRDRERRRRQVDAPAPTTGQPPYHLGRCIAWDFNGTVVQRHYPQFAGHVPVRVVKKEAS